MLIEVQKALHYMSELGRLYSGTFCKVCTTEIVRPLSIADKEYHTFKFDKENNIKDESKILHKHINDEDGNDENYEHMDEFVRHKYVDATQH